MKTVLKIATLFLIVLGACQSDYSEDTSQAPVSERFPWEEGVPYDQIEVPCLDELISKKTFNAYDESLKQYIRSNPNRPDSLRHVIYLLPLGHMTEEMTKLLTDEVHYLSVFFQMDVKLMPLVPFADLKAIDSVQTRLDPGSNYNGKLDKGGHDQIVREQLETNSLMKHFIQPNMPPDAVVIIGVTEHDLYARGYNWLYGSTIRKSGIGVISTHRITEYPYQMKPNLRKVISKQVANGFSIKNTKDYDCLLNFHKNRNELTNGVFYLSPRALEKLCFSTGFDHQTRFKALTNFWQKEGNEEMVSHYEHCLERLLTCEHTTSSKSDIAD